MSRETRIIRPNGRTWPADKPCPELKSILHNLAHPDPYGGNTDPEYRAAVDAIAAAFGLTDAVEKELRFTMELQRRRA